TTCPRPGPPCCAGSAAAPRPRTPTAPPWSWPATRPSATSWPAGSPRSAPPPDPPRPGRGGTRCPLSEREHRLGDLAGRRIRDRRGGLLEDEQPCPGDLARDRLAVADGEEPVAAAVDDERGDLDLGQAVAPAGCAVEPGKHQAHLAGHLDRG